MSPPRRSSRPRFATIPRTGARAVRSSNSAPQPFALHHARATPVTTTMGSLPATGVGSAIDRGLAVFGRVGWVARLTPIDEGAVFVDLVRGWQEQGGYTEVSTAVNPFPATVSNGVSREDVVRVGGAIYPSLFRQPRGERQRRGGPWLRQQFRVAGLRPQFRIDRPVSDPQLDLGRVSAAGWAIASRAIWS